MGGLAKIMTILGALVACCCFALVVPSQAQNHEPSSQPLQEILTEIKAIREDMRVTESTQILLAELEMQQAVVNRATENLDSVRSKLSDIQRDQKLVANELARAEEQLDKSTNEEEKKSLTDEIERHKGNAAALKLEEQSRLTSVQEMEGRLKTAQDGLETIDKELSAIVAKLRPSGSR
jgi:chromosome segregation ATPase